MRYMFTVIGFFVIVSGLLAFVDRGLFEFLAREIFRITPYSSFHAVFHIFTGTAAVIVGMSTRPAVVKASAGFFGIVVLFNTLAEIAGRGDLFGTGGEPVIIILHAIYAGLMLWAAWRGPLRKIPG